MKNRLNNEPTENPYHLTVKIVKYTRTYDDEQSKGSLGLQTRDFIALVPIDNDEMYKFFAAWLGLPGKLVEVLLEFGHPFRMYARGAVLGPKSVDPEQSALEDHHIFLMSHGLTQIILAKKHLHGKEIQVTVLPESEDHPDGAPTDGVGEGDDLVDFGRKETPTGVAP